MAWKSFAPTIALIFFTSSALADPQEQLLECKNTESGELVYVEMYVPGDFGEPLHCIKDSDFVYDMTACAPTGGWGLSRGTGLAGLVEITHSWAYAYEHRDGKMSASIGPRQLGLVEIHRELMMAAAR